MPTYNGNNLNNNITSGYDYLYGDDGNDRLAADQPGFCVVDGGGGRDFLYLENTELSTYGSISGGVGNDTIVGYRNGDRLYGQDGNDLVIGGYPFAYPTDGSEVKGGSASGDDRIEGGGSRDALYGLGGADRIYGGDGNDKGTVSAPGFHYWNDTTSLYSVKAGLFGGIGEDYLDGGDGEDYLDGGSDDDRLIGGDGADTLIGGGGADRMSGGGENDLYAVDNSGDKVIEAGDEGSDLARTSVNYTLGKGQSVEKLYTALEGGTTALKLTGNEFANILRGNAGGNTLDGKGGSDTLYGLGGKDNFLFSTAPGSGNLDRIKDFSHADDTIRLDNAVFKGVANGALKVAAFRDITDSSTLDADDRVLYNHDTGRLYHDPDGNGAKAKVQVAILDGDPTLTANDFFIV